MADYPLIRDVIEIDQRVQDFYDGFSGGGPVYLLARQIRFASGFTDLRVGRLPLVIIADEFDGTNGIIDARGAQGAGQGGAGSDGAAGVLLQHGSVWHSKSAENGHPGGPGPNAGGPAGKVTLLCRTSANVTISTLGGVGSVGGPGGHGGRGIDGHYEYNGDPDNPQYELIPGTHGGYGGRGGTGGPGGPGGQLNFVGIAEPAGINLEAGGGLGGPGGPNGRPGADGAYYEAPDDGDPPTDDVPTTGKAGPAGSGAAASYELVSPEGFLERMRDELGGYTSYWAPFRVVMGEYYYRQFHPGVDSDHGRMAALEFDRALEFQPDNAEAIRLKEQLVGYPERVAGSDVEVWRGGGMNALGLPYNLDLLPQFNNYQGAYVGFSALALDLLTISTGPILTAEVFQGLTQLASNQLDQAKATAANAKNDQDTAGKEQQFAANEVNYRQQQLDKVTADIKAKMAEMQQHPFNITGFIGTVAAVAGAVVSVIGAIPTAGASLVALVPSVLALSKAVADDIGPIADALFAGKEPALDDVTKAAKGIGKEAGDIVKATDSVVKFVKLIDTITSGSTPDNSKYVALVKEGAVAAHDLLLAQHGAALAGQRMKAADAAAAGADAVVTSIAQANARLAATADSMRSVGLAASQTARARMDVLLNFAFRAQRSVEIVTLLDEERNIAFDAGRLHPDIERAYREGMLDGAAMIRELSTSWAKLLEPSVIQAHFLDFLSDPDRDHDVAMLSFKDPADLEALRTTRKLDFPFDPAPRNRREAKARNVAVALIGASPPSISCAITHDGRYEQIAADGELAVQPLRTRTSTRVATTVPLNSVPDVDGDFALTDPEALAFWGRGVGGKWELAVAHDEPNNNGLDLDGLTEVQIWIGYQFLRS